MFDGFLIFCRLKTQISASMLLYLNLCNSPLLKMKLAMMEENVLGKR